MHTYNHTYLFLYLSYAPLLTTKLQMCGRGGISPGAFLRVHHSDASAGGQSGPGGSLSGRGQAEEGELVLQ